MVNSSTLGPAPVRRRDLQKEQTRLDLALAAFELAKAEGLANVRVPQIAEAVGVSTTDILERLPEQGGGHRLAGHPERRPPSSRLGRAACG